MEPRFDWTPYAPHHEEWAWKWVRDLKGEDEVKGFGIVVAATPSPSKPGYTGITRDRLLRGEMVEEWLSDSLVLVRRGLEITVDNAFGDGLNVCVRSQRVAHFERFDIAHWFAEQLRANPEILRMAAGLRDG